MPAQLHLISTHPAGIVSEKRVLDVVFVHGLGGDPFGTWRYGQDDSTSWPHWLADEYGERIGVWSFGYPARKSTAPRFRNQLKQALGSQIIKDKGFSMPLPRRAGHALNKMVKLMVPQAPRLFSAFMIEPCRAERPIIKARLDRIRCFIPLLNFPPASWLLGRQQSRELLHRHLICAAASRLP